MTRNLSAWHGVWIGLRDMPKAYWVGVYLVEQSKGLKQLISSTKGPLRVLTRSKLVLTKFGDLKWLGFPSSVDQKALVLSTSHGMRVLQGMRDEEPSNTEDFQ
jgi:putative methionine-R-sulfoxide reductase with GAF domain